MPIHRPWRLALCVCARARVCVCERDSRCVRARVCACVCARARACECLCMSVCSCVCMERPSPFHRLVPPCLSPSHSLCLSVSLLSPSSFSRPSSFSLALILLPSLSLFHSPPRPFALSPTSPFFYLVVIPPNRDDGGVSGAIHHGGVSLCVYATTWTTGTCHSHVRMSR